jgi:flagellar motor switch protein FliN/FliY
VPNSVSESGNQQALVASSQTLENPELSESSGLGPPVSLLPVELDVAVPVRDFRVRNLLALEPGQLIESRWGNGEDVPLASGEVQLAWSEFEVIEMQLAVRITRLA